MNLFFKKNNNYRKELKINNKPGFTLIEALTVLFIFSLITLTFYSVFTLGTSYIIESKNRLGAVSLANEKMEIIRNLEYADIGVAGGIPDGDIQETEITTSGNKEYEIKTLVKYIDDAFDGTFPEDIIFNDYKVVKVSILWSGVKNKKSEFSLVARFVPPGIEQGISGGILSINIIGSDGKGVPQASVNITNPNVSPTVNVTVKTDDSGNIMLPGAKESLLGYRMQVSKDGYETVETIEESSVTYSVIDVPASVVEGMLNVKTIVQDEIVDLTFRTIDNYSETMDGIRFDLSGGRILGHDMLSSPAEPVYNVHGTYQTDSNGEEKIEGISPGEFFVSAITIPEGYALIGMDNFDSFDQLTGKYRFVVAPGEERLNNIRLADNALNSVLVKVSDSADGRRLDGATVTLSNTDGYSATAVTLSDGVTYFSSGDATPLAPGTYSLKVETENYQEYNTEVEIADGLIEQQAGLTLN